MEEQITDLISSATLLHEFSHLKGTCYLDHTGSALYAKSHLEAVTRDLSENLYSNPHSNSLPSRLCCDTVDQVRYRLLQHFNTTSAEYNIIFTSGATEALKTVAETFNFTGDTSTLDSRSELPCNIEKYNGKLIYLKDNHTSVLGMRSVDNISKNNVCVESLQHDEAFRLLSQSSSSLDVNTLPSKGIVLTDSKNCLTKENALFVYPAQCNFSGIKYPLSWIQQVQDGYLDTALKETRRYNWYCLLDAATFVSTNPLDLSVHKPDFVTVSFYKMFGLPTGLGALIVRNSSALVLHKRYFGGGTVQIAMASKPKHVLRPVLHQRFEDGTVNFLSIIALRHGLDWLDRSQLTMQVISNHCFRLASYTHSCLRSLRHANDHEASYIYADTAYDDPTTQGGIVTFNMLRDTGEFVGYMEVLTLANLHGIHLRTGCFCNPGTCQRLLGISDEQYYKNFEAGHVCGDDRDLLEGQPTGAVRVSFGLYSTQEDVYKLLNMLTECFVSKSVINVESNNCQKNLQLFNETFTKLKIHETKEQNIFCDINLQGNSNSEYERDSNLYDGPIHLEHLDSKPIYDRSDLLTLSQICLYPVKSCGAMRVNSWPLDDRGLMYDRCWMIVNSSGVAMTQKHDIQMCLIKPIIDIEKGVITFTFKGKPSCTIPLEMAKSTVSEAWLCQSKVCGDNVHGEDCGDEVAEWLSRVLGNDGLRLIHQSKATQRLSKNKEGLVTSLTLSNQAQFLLINENSVAWLADKLPDDSDCSKRSMIDRFRSNFVMRGNCPAFEEQKWRTQVKIGSITFRVDGPCGRCQMICIDQSTGVKTKEPLTTLAANSQGRMKFGIYLTQENPTKNSYVKTGDIIFPVVT